MTEPIFKYDIDQKYTIPTGVAGSYDRGVARPDGVGVHSSGNRNASVENEIAYMSNNYMNAFTSAWAGPDYIREIASTDYMQWGIGQYMNPHLAQIEMTEDKRLTDKQHLTVIDRTAFWSAVQLWYYGLDCIDAEKTGKGTVWTHNAVSHHKGGTNHVDPIAYLKRHGSSWTEMFNQTKAYYDVLKASGDTNDVVSIADKVGSAAVIKKRISVPEGKELQKYVGNDGEWSRMYVGDTVTIRPGHQRWLNKNLKQMEKANKDYAGTTDTIETIHDVKIGYSDHAYLLKKLDVIVLQQDLVEPREFMTHTVQKGDTLYSVSQKYDLTVAELKKYNSLTSDLISIGQELIVVAPDSKAPSDVPKNIVEKEVQPVVEATKPKAIELADNEVLLDGTVYVVTEKD